jgi:hypothetical protein
MLSCEDLGLRAPAATLWQWEEGQEIHRKPIQSPDTAELLKQSQKLLLMIFLIWKEK